MRIYIFLLIFILTSCASRKIQFVRTKGQPQEVLVASVETKKSNTNLDFSIAPEIQSQDGVELENQLDITRENSNYKSNYYPKPPVVQDSIKNNDFRVQAALEAEKDAKNSVATGAGALGLFVVSFLGITWVLGVVFFVISALKYSRAKNARYITPEGIDKVKTAKILLILNTILMVVSTALLILLILLLLFF